MHSYDFVLQHRPVSVPRMSLFRKFSKCRDNFVVPYSKVVAVICSYHAVSMSADDQ